MVELRVGIVERIVRASSRRVDLLVRLEGDAGPGGGSARAYALPEVGYGSWHPGQRVLLNTAAVSLGLGSGGYHLVVAPLDAPSGSPSGWQRGAVSRRTGHIMKLRYTPLQLAVRAVEEPGAPYHRALGGDPQLHGFPVAIAALHSMVVPVAAAFRWASGCLASRLAYVMTDSAALPAATSFALQHARQSRLVDLVVTAGQSFGGDLEAVHPASALACAARSGADAAIVAPGPGVVGTATSLGTTSLETAAIIDLVHALGGRALVVARITGADRRRRHFGLSHHDRTVLGRVVRSTAVVVLPSSLPSPLRRLVVRQMATAGVLSRHAVVQIDPAPVRRCLEALPVSPASMGRGVAEDPPFFDSCLAAGHLLADWAAVPRASRRARERDPIP